MSSHLLIFLGEFSGGLDELFIFFVTFSLRCNIVINLLLFTFGYSDSLLPIYE